MFLAPHFTPHTEPHRPPSTANGRPRGSVWPPRLQRQADGLHSFLGDESFQTPATRGVPGRWPRYPSTTYSRPVPESSIEGFCVREKQVFDVCQTLDFKLLWLLFNHFSVKTNKQTKGPRGSIHLLLWRCAHSPSEASSCQVSSALLGQRWTEREPLLSSLPQRKR